MSATDSTRESSSPLAELPVFELAFDVDEVSDPAWVTLYSPAASELETHWMSMDADHAVDLDAVA